MEMFNLKFLLWLPLLLCLYILGLTLFPISNIAQNVVTTGAFNYGAALPGTCVVGATFSLTTTTAGQNLYVCTALNTWTVQSPSTNTKIRSFSASFDGGGIALISGQTKYTTIPYACTISAYNILADAGTATIKIWKISTGTAIPTVANNINTSGISLSSGTAIHSTTVTDFTTTVVSANDIVGVNLFAVSSATYVNVVIQCDAT